MNRAFTWLALMGMLTGCPSTEVDPTCEPDEGNIREVTEEVLLTRVRSLCPEEGAAQYLVTTEQQDDFGAPTGLEMRVAEHAFDTDRCPTRETHTFSALTDDDTFTYELLLESSADPEAPAISALNCTWDAEHVTRALLLYDEAGDLSDCAVWGDAPEYFLDDRDYTACLNWNREE